MSGNVWEWTRSIWVDSAYPYPAAGQARLERENLALHNAPRVLRGGAYFYNARHVRCAVRHRANPDLGYRHWGFRLAVSPFTSDL